MRCTSTSAPLLALGALVFLGCTGTPKGRGEAIFYPPPPDEPRLQYLGRFTGSDDIETRSAFKRFVVGKVQEKAILRAHGVAWHDHKLYVCDAGLPHVVVFDFAAREMRLLDPKHKSIFKKCIDIAIAPDGWKYITDTGHKKVLIYDAKNIYRGAIGGPEVWKPVGVAASKDRLYVTDVANHQLVILDRRSGKEEKRIGSKGAAEGSFYYPLSVQVGPDGDIYVSDSFNFRIQRLKPDGTFVRSYGSVGNRPGNFARPRGIALDREGRIYAVDAAFENVQIMDHEGKLLLFFGGPGGDPGNINLPASVAVSYEAVPDFANRVAKGFRLAYVVFVTSQTGPNKVCAYGLLKKR